MDATYSVHEIVSLDDEIYDEFLELYQVSFPLNEQMLVSSHNEVLRRKARGEAPNDFLLSALSPERALVAMACYDICPDDNGATLWYLAVQPDMRSRGTGSWFYQEIIRHARQRLPDLGAFCFEVEDPAHCECEADRDLARRRIGFYRRNGALLLTGVSYTQSVGWQPAIPMYVMIHPLAATEVEELFEIAQALLGGSLRGVDKIGLS